MGLGVQVGGRSPHVASRQTEAVDNMTMERVKVCGLLRAKQPLIFGPPFSVLSFRTTNHISLVASFGPPSPSPTTLANFPIPLTTSALISASLARATVKVRLTCNPTQTRSMGNVKVCYTMPCRTADG